MSGQTEKLPDTLYGYPFYEQNDLPQDRLYFADWSYYIIGDRQTMTVKTTTEGGDAWRRKRKKGMKSNPYKSTEVTESTISY